MRGRAAQQPGGDAWLRRGQTMLLMLLAVGTSMALLIGPAQATSHECEASYFSIDAIPSPEDSGVTAGTPFTVTVRAFDGCNQPLTGYNGPATLSGAGDSAPGNSPNGTPAPDGAPEYGPLAWENGVGAATVTLYAAQLDRQISVSDGTLAPATSNAFEVDPGPLASFTFAEIGTRTAGWSFGVQVTAYDGFGNVKDDYAGGATLGGASGFAPGDSPNGSPAPSGAPAYGALSWTNGVGSADVTLYKAESGRKLEVVDGVPEDLTPDVSAVSNAFEVDPGPLASFTFAEIGTRTAGWPFGVQVTAYDGFGNVKDDYAGGATLGGASGFAPGDSPNGDQPSYGEFSWTDGVGSADVTLYKAESARKLAVDDAAAAVSATSGEFDVAPGPLASFTFAQIGQEFGPPIHYVVDLDLPFNVSLTAYDAFGNVKTDYTGGAALSGNLGATASYGSPSWSSGVGSASVQAGEMGINRQVTATDGLVSDASDEFDVVAEVCSGGTSCEGQSANGAKKVQLVTPLGTGTASIGFYNPPGNTFDCLLKDGTTRTMTVRGAISLVDPPPGYTADNPLTLVMRLAKDATVGTGVANHIVCLSKNRGLSYEQVVDCGNKFKKSEIPCISSRSRTGVGESVFELKITSTDPWGGIE